MHPRTRLITFSQKHQDCIDAQIFVKAKSNGGILGSGKGNELDFRDYKYVFNVGNNGYADRVKLLLAGGNVIFQHTGGWEEWFYGAMVPYVHYIPIKQDFSDLCSKLELVKRSPKAAAAISRNARAFYEVHLNPKARDTYIVEILQQWGELWDAHVTKGSNATVKA
jgi:hypothetical protein